MYNVVLNIKQTQTESELENLKITLDSHKELFDNVSKDLIVISEKIKIVELDLEDVKASSKDIEELKEIKRSNETEFVQMACSAKDPVFSTKSDTWPQDVKFNQSGNEDSAWHM